MKQRKTIISLIIFNLKEMTEFFSFLCSCSKKSNTKELVPCSKIVSVLSYPEVLSKTCDALYHV